MNSLMLVTPSSSASRRTAAMAPASADPRTWWKAKSMAHDPSASAMRASKLARTSPPATRSAKSMIVVVPPCAAAIVPVSKLSLDTNGPCGICRCTWASTPPGIT